MAGLNHCVRLNAAALLLLVSFPSRATAAVTVPRTPAGRVLGAMLDAFNSDDRTRVTAYVKKYQPNGDRGTVVLIDHMLDLRHETGGFELVRIEHAERLAMDFVIDEKAGPRTWFTHLEVTDGKTPRVIELQRDEIPRGSSVGPMRVDVDGATRARVLDGVAHQLTDWYVYPDVAKEMVERLRAHQTMGEYDGITDGRKLARAINHDLHSVTPDGHLSVDCTPDTLPPNQWREPPPLDVERRVVDEHAAAELLRQNCGFEKVDRLEGNIGYLKLDRFGPLSVCATTASAAMNLLAHVDALIVDLRDNGGGAAAMVSYVASYLFDARTHLNDLYERKRNKTIAVWTRDVPGPKLGGKVPVYVLAGRRTFSAGEELTYDLKYLKRATIVGENTAGGAHPTAPIRIDDHFVIDVPYARSVNPVTKTDWEGTGVAPGVEVAADQALEVAKKLAAEAIRQKAATVSQ